MEFGQSAIEGTERQMTGLASDLQHQAIRKPQCWSPAKVFERRSNDLRVLQCQVLMVEEQLDRLRDCCRIALVHSAQDPHGFGKHEMRDPRPAFDKKLRRRDLLGVVSRDQTGQDVRVNGSHGAS